MYHIDVDGDFTPIQVTPPERIENSEGLRDLFYVMEYLMNLSKAEITKLQGLASARRCPDEWLPLLATNIGYKYSYTESPAINRMVMSYWWKLYNNRGNETGFKLAAALSVKGEADYLSDSDFAMYTVDINYSTGIISLYYPREQERFRNFKDIVRPAGMKLVWVPSVSNTLGDTATLSDTAVPTSAPSSADVGGEVDFTEVGDS